MALGLIEQIFQHLEAFIPILTPYLFSSRELTDTALQQKMIQNFKQSAQLENWQVIKKLYWKETLS